MCASASLTVLLEMLHTTGMTQVCSQLEDLQLSVRAGFESVAVSIRNASAKEHARALHTKLEVVMNTYNVVLEAVVPGKSYPGYVKDDAKEAKRNARELYAWAKSHLSARSKKAKLQNLPYVVAMAFAVRVEMDACIIESEMMARIEDQISHLERSWKGVEKFMRVVMRQVVEVTMSTSLLEIAYHFRLHVATYMTLMRSFRASMVALSSPHISLDDICTWDSGPPEVCCPQTGSSPLGPDVG